MKTPLFTCTLVAALITSASATVTMDWVTIGNANNAADQLTGYGAVDHAYRIGKYEVTNAQYVDFLNAKAKSDTYALYSGGNGMPAYGIVQNGVAGLYTYSVSAGFTNRPVVGVSWSSAARFANWLVNGQGDANTESGTYEMTLRLPGRAAGSEIFLPSEDEWYKAAYYNADLNAYSLYPNGEYTINQQGANYNFFTGTTIDVGSFVSSPSSYGTFDQGGNIWEWNEAIINHLGSSNRGYRGGSWYENETVMRSTLRTNGENPSNQGNLHGFRLAAIPEPSALVLLIIASGLLTFRRSR